MAKEFVKFDGKTSFNKDNLVDNVKKYYDEKLESLKFAFEEGIVFCESPIEQILSVEMDTFSIYNFSVFNPNIELLGKTKNEDIICGNKTYRVDFLLDIIFKMFNSEISYLLVIECDGFEYHHGNKGQIDIDYERQANLLAYGYDVIRFTGSKIVKNPYACVKDIIKHIIKKYDTVLKINKESSEKYGR